MTIQEALDRCLEDISVGNLSVDECLARYPQYASQLRPLLRTAARLEAANEVRPSRAFKSNLRKQLTSDSDKPRRRFFSLRAFFVWTVILLLIVSFAVWMGINFEVAGRSSTPIPINYENLIGDKLVFVVQTSPEVIRQRPTSSLYSADCSQVRNGESTASRKQAGRSECAPTFARSEQLRD